MSIPVPSTITIPYTPGQTVAIKSRPTLNARIISATIDEGCVWKFRVAYFDNNCVYRYGEFVSDQLYPVHNSARIDVHA